MRRPDLEKQVKDRYSVKAEVHHKAINSDSYEMKLVKGLKDCVLKEVMERGLTKFVTLTISDKTEVFKEYYLAEEKAIQYLKG